MMSDTEIDLKLAVAMGFPKDGLMRDKGWINVQNTPYRGHYLFAPTALWHDIGICLDWMKYHKDLHLDASYITHSPDGPFYVLRFLSPDQVVAEGGESYPDLSLRSIALAILKAVEE